MNVGELKKMLDKYPDDMEVITDRYSDYVLVLEKDWSVARAVPTHQQEWLMRSHDTMSAENKAKEKDYLHLVGN